MQDSTTSSIVNNHTSERVHYYGEGGSLTRVDEDRSQATQDDHQLSQPQICRSDGGVLRCKERSDVTTTEQKEAIRRLRAVPDLRKSALLGPSVKDRLQAFSSKGKNPSSIHATELKGATSVAGPREINSLATLEPVNEPVIPEEDDKLIDDSYSEEEVAVVEALTLLTVVSWEDEEDAQANESVNIGNKEEPVVHAHEDDEDKETSDEEHQAEAFDMFTSYEEQRREARRRHGTPNVRRTNSTHAHTPFAEKLKAFQKSRLAAK